MTRRESLNTIKFFSFAQVISRVPLEDRSGAVKWYPGTFLGLKLDASAAWLIPGTEFENLRHSSSGDYRRIVGPLAITSAARHPSVPEVPTMIEAGLEDFESQNWIALFAPRGTPDETIELLNKEINRIVQTPAMREKFARVGAAPMHGAPQRWEAYVREEVVKWGKVIKAAGVKAE